MSSSPGSGRLPRRGAGAKSLVSTATELQIWWDGIETDKRRLIAAIELLRRLSLPPAQGVFR